MDDTPRSDPATCDRFVNQMLVYHQHRDRSPNPTVIGAVVQTLRAKAWRESPLARAYSGVADR